MGKIYFNLKVTLREGTLTQSKSVWCFCDHLWRSMRSESVSLPVGCFWFAWNCATTGWSLLTAVISGIWSYLIQSLKHAHEWNSHFAILFVEFGVPDHQTLVDTFVTPSTHLLKTMLLPTTLTSEELSLPRNSTLPTFSNDQTHLSVNMHRKEICPYIKRRILSVCSF